jgi:hypothetical protein
MNYCTNYKYNLLHFIIQPPPARYNEIDSLITVLLLGTVTSASNNRIKRREKNAGNNFPNVCVATPPCNDLETESCEKDS